MNQSPEFKRMEISHKWDEAFDAEKWRYQLPYFSFPAHWQIRIIPSEMFSVIRFKVKHQDSNNPYWDVSVYFDAYNLLGHMPEPYWEIYPDAYGDTNRFLLGFEKEMLEAIEESLQKQLEKNHEPKS